MIRILYILTCCFVAQNFTPQIFAKEVLNSNGQPSEYALQMEIIAILRHLLSTVHPTLHYRVLPEAKEYDEKGQRRKRLDILVRNEHRPKYGFELLAEANKTTFDDHCKKSSYYGQVHGCSMTMVHFTRTGNLCKYFGPEEIQDVTVMHVLYNQTRAKLVEKDWEEEVAIQGAYWKIGFEKIGVERM